MSILNKKRTIKVNRYQEIQAAPLLVCENRENLVNIFKRSSFKKLKTKENQEKLKYRLIALSMQVLVVVLIILGGIFALCKYYKLSTINYSDIISNERESNVKKELTLVNKNYCISKNYEVDLVDFEGIKCDSLIKNDLSDLLKDAKAAGFELILSKGYIDFNSYETDYKNKLQDLVDQGHSKVNAELELKKEMNPPGQNEYQTGLAVDIIQKGVSAEEFEHTAAYRWLMKNSVNYGFILRNPKGKESKTGEEFDSVHYRYVGKENAMKMRTLGMCFEEYCKYRRK